MSTSEREIQNSIRLMLPTLGCTAWRANVGQAWTGSEIQRLPDGSMFIRNARPFASGLPPGFSDLFGMVHETGKFFAIEVKSQTGRPTKQQENFIEFINNHGGLAGIARSVDDAKKIIGG